MLRLGLVPLNKTCKVIFVDSPHGAEAVCVTEPQLPSVGAISNKFAWGVITTPYLRSTQRTRLVLRFVNDISTTATSGPWSTSCVMLLTRSNVVPNGSHP